MNIQLHVLRGAISILPICLTILPLSAAEQARPGVIQFSDGERIAGRISLTPNTSFTLHGKTQVWTVALGRIREIRCSPEKEEMVRAWRFPEAGQTRKELAQTPYPVRHIQTTILTEQETLTGHLFTTVLYVETPEKNQKVILYAKQRGQEGDTLDALVYPVRIAFSNPVDAASHTAPLHLNLTGAAAPNTELAALTRPALVRLMANRIPPSHDFELPPPLGHCVFLALKSGNVIQIGWPSTNDPALTAQVKEALALTRDFFDERDLLGVFREEPSREDVYALILLSRKGSTTLSGDRTQPWRASVWRWKRDPVDSRLMLAGRGDFFRGIIAPQGESLPQVTISDALWSHSQSIGSPGMETSDLDEHPISNKEYPISK